MEAIPAPGIFSGQVSINSTNRRIRVGGRALRQAQHRRGLCLGAEKLEARKMLENAAESPASSARFVGWRFEETRLA